MIKQTCPSCGSENQPNSRYCSGCGFALPQAPKEIESNDPPPLAAGKQAKAKPKMAVVIASIAAASISSYFAQKMFTPRPPSYEKALVAAANEMNKMCPMMVDRSTRLDNTVAIPGNTFQYNYTIIDVEKSEVKLDTVRKYLEPGIIENVKISPDMKLQREHKTTFIYKYKDKNGVEIYTLKITPDMYQ